jgi:hypothetical protein
MYERQFDVELPFIGRVDIDKAMATIGGILAAGVGADMLASRLTRRWKSEKTLEEATKKES